MSMYFIFLNTILLLLVLARPYMNEAHEDRIAIDSIPTVAALEVGVYHYSE